MSCCKIVGNIEDFGQAILVCIGYVTARSLIDAYMTLDEESISTDQGHSASISTTSYQGLEALSRIIFTVPSAA